MKQYVVTVYDEEYNATQYYYKNLDNAKEKCRQVLYQWVKEEKEENDIMLRLMNFCSWGDAFLDFWNEGRNWDGLMSCEEIYWED